MILLKTKKVAFYWDNFFLENIAVKIEKKNLV